MAHALLILGAGQFGAMVKEIADSTKEFERIAFLDDRSPAAIGTLDSFSAHRQEFDCATVAIGLPALRLDYLEKLAACGYTLAPIVSPLASVSPSATLSIGCIVEPMAVLQTEATLGKGCIVSSGAVIRHNATVGDGCHVDCNAVVLSNVTVPEKTKIPALTAYTL